MAEVAVPVVAAEGLKLHATISDFIDRLLGANEETKFIISDVQATTETLG